MTAATDQPQSARGKAAFLRDLGRPPNLVCLARVVLLWASIQSFYAGWFVGCFAFGIVGGLTDYLDGWLARRLNMVSELGALLDQVTDLLFAFVCLSLLAVEGFWPTYLLLAWGFRDISVLAMRLSAAQLRLTIPSSKLGKVASNFLFYSFIFGFLDMAGARGLELGEAKDAVRWVGLGAVHIGVVLQWVTAFGYLRVYVRNYEGSEA